MQTFGMLTWILLSFISESFHIVSSSVSKGLWSFASYLFFSRDVWAEDSEPLISIDLTECENVYPSSSARNYGIEIKVYPVCKFIMNYFCMFSEA